MLTGRRGTELAGRSVAEEYQARRSDWLAGGGRRARQRARVAAAVLVVLAGTGCALLGAATHVALLALVWLCVVGLVAAAAVLVLFGGPPSDVAELDAQARAERVTADGVVPLARAGYRLLFDRDVPGGGGQVDLLVIGPTGIFVVTVIPGWRGVAAAGTAVYAGPIPLRGAAR